MAKKKKTQLKPIARGFATTSLPKKVVPVQDDEAPSTPEQNAASLNETEATSSFTPDQDAVEASPATAVPESKEFDPEKAEEQSLQNLVDKLQERVEKDIRRSIKVCYIRTSLNTVSNPCYRAFTRIGATPRPCLLLI